MSMFLSWHLATAWILSLLISWEERDRRILLTHAMEPSCNWGFHSGIWKLSNARQFYLLKIFFDEDFIFFLWTFSMADQEFMQMFDQYKMNISFKFNMLRLKTMDDRAQWLTWSWCRCSTNCSKPSQEPERCRPSYLLFLFIIFYH